MARWLVKNIAKYDIVSDDDGCSYARIFAKDSITGKWTPKLTCHTSVIGFIGGTKEGLHNAINEGLLQVIK